MEVFWLSEAPKKCDTCGADIKKVFYDAKTGTGPWGCLCPSCWAFGPGIGLLGTGLGQRYEKQSDGRWKKTAG